MRFGVLDCRDVVGVVVGLARGLRGRAARGGEDLDVLGSRGGGRGRGGGFSLG